MSDPSWEARGRAIEGILSLDDLIDTRVEAEGGGVIGDRGGIRTEKCGGEIPDLDDSLMLLLEDDVDVAKNGGPKTELKSCSVGELGSVIYSWLVEGVLVGDSNVGECGSAVVLEVRDIGFFPR